LRDKFSFEAELFAAGEDQVLVANGEVVLVANGDAVLVANGEAVLVVNGEVVLVANGEVVPPTPNSDPVFAGVEVEVLDPKSPVFFCACTGGIGFVGNTQPEPEFPVSFVLLEVLELLENTDDLCDAEDGGLGTGLAVLLVVSLEFWSTD
jgi:hypothetical protein